MSGLLDFADDDTQPAERLKDAGALAPSARRETLHGDRLAARGFRHLAAEQAVDEVELLRRATERGSDGQRLVVVDATGGFWLAHQRLPFLSAACPGKVRVGANSPSL